MLTGTWALTNELLPLPGLACEEFLQAAQIVAGGELLESFTALAVLEVGAEHGLNRARKFTGGHTREDLAAYGLVLPEAAADKDVIGVEGFSADFGFGAEAADVTDIMLGA